ncbi:MAG: class I SAM-dependent methyltransferase [Desulfobacteraceae bacterium]|nr:class I SAM-dependent methyltransferase [Desulfobacteraceae bacterium]
MNIPRWIVRCIPNFILDPIRPIAGRLLGGIHYSKDFYEKDYHTKEYKLPQKNLESVIKNFVQVGQKQRLYEVLDKIRDIPVPKNWLEIGCAFGKTTFWLAEYYDNTKFFMFDFAQTAIDFINTNNPIPERTVVWKGNVANICNDDCAFDDFFEFASLLDITEHLPKDIYFRCISEAYRVIRPGGGALLKQGNEILPEHINIRWEWQLIRDFKKAGFLLARRLPYRHYLLRKPVRRS